MALKKIVFTGGGSSGHVTPNLGLIKKFLAQDTLVEYIGSHSGIEKQLIAPLNIPYHAVATGKLRRYFSWKNFLAPWKIILGICQVFFMLRKIQPQVIFSKGGFVAFPVVIGAWLNRIPVITHESDLMPGLANKLIMPFAKKICVTFAETKNYLSSPHKVIVSGAPIRETFYQANPELGRQFCNFADPKPAVFIVGGGHGSVVINRIVREALPELLKQYNVIHVCGRGNTEANLDRLKGYLQIDYLADEFADVLSYAEYVISRAGSNSLYEILFLKKPHILIPLSKKASRGDQIDNAAYFDKKGVSVVINEERLSKSILLDELETLAKSQIRKDKIHQLNIPNGLDVIFKLLNQQ